MDNCKTIVAMQPLDFTAQTTYNVTVSQAQNTWLAISNWHQLTHNVPADETSRETLHTQSNLSQRITLRSFMQI